MPRLGLLDDLSVRDRFAFVVEVKNLDAAKRESHANQTGAVTAMRPKASAHQAYGAVSGGLDQSIETPSNFGIGEQRI